MLKIISKIVLLTSIFMTMLPIYAQTLPLNNVSSDALWMTLSTILVLFMTIPGLLMFYGGLGRRQNVLFTSVQLLVVTASVSIVWLVGGYSLAFSSQSAFSGGLDRFFGQGVFEPHIFSLHPVVMEGHYFLFQMAFAIVAMALIVGATAERMRLSTTMAFSVGWTLAVYAPIAHWIWHPEGWLNAMGHLDWAGGAVIHMSAGISGLMAAKIIGSRTGFPIEPMPPHNLLLSGMGACFLWIGWLGFNTGTTLALDGDKMAQTLFITFCAGCAGALSWASLDYLRHQKISLLGLITGAIVGLVAITPAAGYVGLNAAFVIPVVAVTACVLALSFVKNVLHIDDSFDVFAIHGVGGLMGSLLTPVFAFSSRRIVFDHLIANMVGAVAVLFYAGAVTALLLWVLKPVTGWRVDVAQEKHGLDLTQLGETIEA
jgi:ammonium transporter, Amt family